MKHIKIALVLSLLSFYSFGQADLRNGEPFSVQIRETNSWLMIYDLLNENGEIIRTLDTAKYASIDFQNDELRHFGTFQLKGSRGFYAINSEEEILFRVYNTSVGEAAPDVLIENKIRTIGENGRIGYANEFGQTIIEPQFEFATSFHNNRAIIGKSCEKILLHSPESETGCQHYSTQCLQYGYIDQKGEILEIGDYTFEEVMNRINWKQVE